MKTKPTTALQIRNGKLVVGGFFVGDWAIPGTTITNPRFYHHGDFFDPSQPPDIDIESEFQREVTMMYNLEGNQLQYATSLEPWIGLSIPNKAQIDPGLREATLKALYPEVWYQRSRGTVSREPAFEGQKPMKDVVVIGGGGFRRGVLPLISTDTPRLLNHGLTPEEVSRFNPRRDQNIGGKSNMVGKLWGELRAFADKHQLRAIVNGNLY